MCRVALLGGPTQGPSHPEGKLVSCEQEGGSSALMGLRLGQSGADLQQVRREVLGRKIN